MCSSRCSPPAVHLFCFTHYSQSSLAATSSPQTPIRCSLYSQKNKIGGLSLHVFLLACGSLRADRAVMLFAISPVPTVASFQSLVPLSFHSATFSTPHKSSSFTSLHEPTQFHSAIRLLCLQLVFGGLIKMSNTPTLITASNCSIPPTKSFRSVQSLPLPFPTLKQKIMPALP